MTTKNFFSQISAIIIDDDKNVAATLADYLELHGISIIAVGYNGKAAVELYQRFKPNVVFLDVMMPDYDGFYGLEKIKQFDPTAKVIMATADTTQQTQNRLATLGADLIVYKPFDIKEILTSISRMIESEVASH
jgi:DNA-binding response OmpR family regulator